MVPISSLQFVLLVLRKEMLVCDISDPSLIWVKPSGIWNMSLMSESVISHVSVNVPPDRCPARRVWSTASWRPSAH